MPDGANRTFRRTTHALIRARTSCSDTRDNNLLAVTEDNVQHIRSVTGMMHRIVVLQRDMDANQGMVELLCSAEYVETYDPCRLVHVPPKNGPGVDVTRVQRGIVQDDRNSSNRSRSRACGCRRGGGNRRRSAGRAGHTTGNGVGT